MKTIKIIQTGQKQYAYNGGITNKAVEYEIVEEIPVTWECEKLNICNSDNGECLGDLLETGEGTLLKIKWDGKEYDHMYILPHDYAMFWRNGNFSHFIPKDITIIDKI